jgi:hypothetical protein
MIYIYSTETRIIRKNDIQPKLIIVLGKNIPK